MRSKMYEPLYDNGEAFIVGYRPLVRQDGTVVDTLGALLVMCDGCDFDIATGFTDHDRQHLWHIKETLVDTPVEFRYLGVGANQRPRHPVYVGLRNRIDL